MSSTVDGVTVVAEPDAEAPKPTVLMVHDYPPLSGGGLAISANELARQLGDEFTFRLLSSRLRDHFADDQLAVAAGGSGGQRGRAGVARTTAAVTRAGAVVSHWTFSFRRLSTFALLAGPVLGRPTIAVIHTAPDHCDYNRMRHLPAAARRAAFAAARRLLARATAVVALSEWHADALRRAGFPVTHVAPLPVPAPAAGPLRQPPRPGAVLRVGVAGEHSLLKGTDDLPRLLAALTPGAAFDIAGSGELTPRLAAGVAALRAEQRGAVRLRGRLAPAAMPRFYAGVDCLLVLSRTESQCRVAFEAMLAGAVVLGPRLGGMADAVVDGSTGFFVDPSDPASVGAVLDRLAADPALARTVRARAAACAAARADADRRRWRGLLREVTETA